MTFVGLDRNEPTENIMEHSTDARLVPRHADMFDRRSAIGTLARSWRSAISRHGPFHHLDPQNRETRP
jgi:hypothetical protein